MDYRKITNVTLEGIDFKDYPDFTDAFISSAEYNGIELTEKELDKINESSDFVYDCVINDLF